MFQSCKQTLLGFSCLTISSVLCKAMKVLWILFWLATSTRWCRFSSRANSIKWQATFTTRKEANSVFSRWSITSHRTQSPTVWLNAWLSKNRAAFLTLSSKVCTMSSSRLRIGLLSNCRRLTLTLCRTQHRCCVSCWRTKNTLRS